MPWAPDYLTLQQGREYLRVPAGDTTDDTLLAVLISAASRAIDVACHRQFGSAVQTRVYRACDAVQLLDGSAWVLPVDDVADPAAASVTSGGAMLAPRWWPVNATVDGIPATALLLDAPPTADLSVLAPFGWPAVPAPVQAAARLQLGRWWVRRESPYGTAGSPSEGSEEALQYRLDPDVTAMLAGLGRARGLG